MPRLLMVPAKSFEKGEGAIRMAGPNRRRHDGRRRRLARGRADRLERKATAALTLTKKADEKKSPLDKALDFPETYPAGIMGRSGPAGADPFGLHPRGDDVDLRPARHVAECGCSCYRRQDCRRRAGLKTPPGGRLLTAKGLHVTPGIVDCHSHTAISKGVNEATHAVTCEVRIGDVIDATDIDLYRELAGGVIAANVLHGSANPIGGQNQVIKFRWGALPEDLKFAGAMPGMKFALGENVKQSNWGDKFTTRYPQTRMGVEELIRDRFRAAQEYEAAQKKKEGLPPRRDLQLEALSRFSQGKRLIHCHSYRQDEVLALLRIWQRNSRSRSARFSTSSKVTK